jgi:hypothetical protein
MVVTFAAMKRPQSYYDSGFGFFKREPGDGIVRIYRSEKQLALIRKQESERGKGFEPAHVLVDGAWVEYSEYCDGRERGIPDLAHHVE